MGSGYRSPTPGSARVGPSQRRRRALHTRCMAYDEELAHRIEDLLATEPGSRSKRMFGGLGFMVDGHLTVSASSSGDLLVRTDPAAAHAWVDDPGVRLMEMRGRPMPGWLLVAREAVRDDAALRTWVERGVSYVRALPPKQA